MKHYDTVTVSPICWGFVCLFHVFEILHTPSGAKSPCRPNCGHRCISVSVACVSVNVACVSLLPTNVACVSMLPTNFACVPANVACVLTNVVCVSINVACA